MKDLIISAKKTSSSTHACSETGDHTVVTGDSIGAGKTASAPHQHRSPSYRVCCTTPPSPSFSCCFCHQQWCLSIHDHYLSAQLSSVVLVDDHGVAVNYVAHNVGAPYL
jgi:hypothetical protein